MTGGVTPRAEPDGERYVIVRFGVGWYAVPVVEVREIVLVPPVTEVPGAGAGLCGVVLVHGAVMTLLDARAALGEPDGVGDARARILAVEHEGERLGLRVDEVARIVHLSPAQIEPAYALTGAPRDHVLGLARAPALPGDGGAIVLDVAPLVRTVLRTAHFS